MSETEMSKAASEINETVARRVLEIVDQGLTRGIGEPIPGKLCVEAAVCLALGLPHSDDPTCVSRALRTLKIRLNDSAWSSNEARAKGMRRLALAQLGSAGVLDDAEFTKRVVALVVTKYVPKALRSAASGHPDQKHKDALEAAAKRCEAEGTVEAARGAQKIARAAAAYAAANAAANAAVAANAAAYAAVAANAAAYAAVAANAAVDAAVDANAAVDAAVDAYAARDQVLSEFAEDVVSILKDMNAPGCQWLDLTDAA